MSSIVVYSKNGCPFCSLLKMELTKRGLTYAEYDLSDDSIRAEFYLNTGLSTVPQVFLTAGISTLTEPSGEHIGGWSECSANWQVFESPL